MTTRHTAVFAMVALVSGVTVSSATAQQANVKAGMLKCLVSGGASFIIGSTKDLECKYDGLDGSRERYDGEIKKYGVDLGVTGKGVMYWTVLAPTGKLGKHALAGSYGGVTAGAAVGVGAGANILLGGSNKTITLQPLSGQVEEGINLAVGVAELTLD